jgi:hypothetical protein
MKSEIWTKNILIILLFGSNILHLNGQTFNLTNEIIIESKFVEYNVIKKEFINSSIPNFVVSRYVESVYQYSLYLDYLSNYGENEEFRNALPDKNYWFQDYLELSSEERIFFSNNYWSNSKFRDFPAIGLSRRQINKYINWKNLLFREAIIIYRLGDKIKFDLESSLAIWDYKFPEERISTFQFPFCGFYSKSYEVILKNEHYYSDDNDFVNWLNNNDEYYKVLTYEPKRKLKVKDEIKILLEKNGIFFIKEYDLLNLYFKSNISSFEWVYEKMKTDNNEELNYFEKIIKR